jgi:hypothetical protein
MFVNSVTRFWREVAPSYLQGFLLVIVVVKIPTILFRTSRTESPASKEMHDNTPPGEEEQENIGRIIQYEMREESLDDLLVEGLTRLESGDDSMNAVKTRMHIDRMTNISAIDTRYTTNLIGMEQYIPHVTSDTVRSSVIITPLSQPSQLVVTPTTPQQTFQQGASEFTIDKINEKPKELVPERSRTRRDVPENKFQMKFTFR